MKKFIHISLIFLTVFGLVTSLQSAHAQIDCETFYTRVATDQELTPTDVFCPLLRLVNFFIGVVGFVFVIVIIWGAIKLSLALGDPKGLAASWATWQYALVGGGIVLAVFAIVIIVSATLGISFDPLNIAGMLGSYMNGLVSAFGISSN